MPELGRSYTITKDNVHLFYHDADPDAFFTATEPGWYWWPLAQPWPFHESCSGPFPTQALAITHLTARGFSERCISRAVVGVKQCPFVPETEVRLFASMPVFRQWLEEEAHQLGQKAGAKVHMEMQQRDNHVLWTVSWEGAGITQWHFSAWPVTA